MGKNTDGLTKRNDPINKLSDDQLDHVAGGGSGRPTQQRWICTCPGCNWSTGWILISSGVNVTVLAVQHSRESKHQDTYLVYESR